MRAAILRSPSVKRLASALEMVAFPTPPGIHLAGRCFVLDLGGEVSVFIQPNITDRGCRRQWRFRIRRIRPNPSGSQAGNFAHAGERFFQWDALRFAALDFVNPAVDLGFPRGLNHWIAGMEVLSQTPHEFAHSLGRPKACLFNYLF